MTDEQKTKFCQELNRLFEQYGITSSTLIVKDNLTVNIFSMQSPGEMNPEFSKQIGQIMYHVLQNELGKTKSGIILKPN